MVSEMWAVSVGGVVCWFPTENTPVSSASLSSRLRAWLLRKQVLTSDVDLI